MTCFSVVGSKMTPETITKVNGIMVNLSNQKIWLKGTECEHRWKLYLITLRVFSRWWALIKIIRGLCFLLSESVVGVIDALNTYTTNLQEWCNNKSCKGSLKESGPLCMHICPLELYMYHINENKFTSLLNKKCWPQPRHRSYHHILSQL